MLRITRLTDYATVILGHMASAPETMYSAKALSETLSMGGATASKILKLLANHGLVISQRGKEGGYRLAKAPENIPVTDILEALEGPLAITECALHQNLCQQSSGCGVKDHWQRINSVIVNALKELSLADLLGATPTHTFFIQPELLSKSLKNGRINAVERSV